MGFFKAICKYYSPTRIQMYSEKMHLILVALRISCQTWESVYGNQSSFENQHSYIWFSYTDNVHFSKALKMLQFCSVFFRSDNIL